MVGKYKKAKAVNMPAGEIVRNAREMLDMSQADLATRAKVLPSHLSEIEAGKRRVGRITAERLGAALDLPPAYILFSGEETRAGAVEETIKILDVRFVELGEQKREVSSLIRRSLAALKKVRGVRLVKEIDLLERAMKANELEEITGLHAFARKAIETHGRRGG